MKLIDVRSLIAGGGLAIGILGLASMMQAPSHIPPLEILGVPTPGQMVQVRQGTPFVVPSGKAFVLTALGKAGTGGEETVNFKVDGQTEAAVKIAPSGGSSAGGFVEGMQSIPPGLTAAAGASLSVDGPLFDSARAWGYLADA